MFPCCPQSPLLSKIYLSYYLSFLFIFSRYPSVLLLDGTHGTNQSNYIVVSGLVLDSRYEGIPVFQCLIKSETSSNITAILEVLKLEVDCSELANIITDLALCYNDPIKKVFPNTLHVKCSFHIENAWTRRIKDTELLHTMKNLRLQSLETDFLSLWDKFVNDYANSEIGKWIIQNYGQSGRVCPYMQWAKCYQLGLLHHNLQIERYHR